MYRAYVACYGSCHNDRARCFATLTGALAYLCKRYPVTTRPDDHLHELVVESAGKVVWHSLPQLIFRAKEEGHAS